MTSREDLYLKKLNDNSVVTPQPVTQREKILSELAGVNGLGVELPTVTASDNGKALVVENGAWALGNASGGSTGGAGLEEITYAELKAKRDSSQLTPGGQYRITDYICTTTQEESRAVSHPFDIIVVADSKDILNENARACLHDGDDYYSAQDHQADLEAWELKYCIDNDNNRFVWADAVNGKGVVYYMKDDRNNECPYDFKQIQFKRYPITECAKVTSLVGKYATLSRSEDITGIDEQNSVWCYTFSVRDRNATSVIYDGSIAPLSFDETAHGCLVLDNKISPLFNYKDLENSEQNILYLNDIVFACYWGRPCYSNTFGDSCYSNTFGDSCYSNTFGDSCYSNTFSGNCHSNTFGNECHFNTFGNYCQSNTFGDYSSSNTFGDSCFTNTFSGNCHSNTFGNNCESNTFGDYSSSNTFGDSCYVNTFGNYCQSNAFGDSCVCVDIEAGISSTNSKRYYHVLDGVQGTKKSHISITGTNGNIFETYVGKNSSGELKTWVPADLAP